MLWSARVDWSAAISAKGMHTPVAPVARFDVQAGLSAQDMEMFGGRRNIGAKYRSRQHLAIRAMTDRDAARRHFGLVLDGPTMALALHSHDASPSEQGELKNDALAGTTSICRSFG
jgi:hypothetical protein